VTAEAKDIIQKMLNRDYNKRPSANELLNHPWFVKASSNDKEENDEERNKALTRLKGFQT
jgi:serine/threonine protein kinase